MCVCDITAMRTERWRHELSLPPFVLLSCMLSVCCRVPICPDVGRWRGVCDGDAGGADESEAHIVPDAGAERSRPRVSVENRFTYVRY